MGGVGESGLGRRHGSEGLLKYTEAKTLARQRVARRKHPVAVLRQKTRHEVANLAVLGQQLAEFLLAGVPLRTPIVVHRDPQANWISFLSHILFV